MFIKRQRSAAGQTQAHNLNQDGHYFEGFPMGNSHNNTHPKKKSQTIVIGPMPLSPFSMKRSQSGSTASTVSSTHSYGSQEWEPRENESDIMYNTTRQTSPAIPCPPPDYVHESEEQMEEGALCKMYDRATWRMYNRIVGARMERSQRCQHPVTKNSQARLCSSKALLAHEEPIDFPPSEVYMQEEDDDGCMFSLDE